MGEGFEVGAGLIIEALEVRVRDEFEEVLVAREIFRQQAEMEDAFALVGAAVFFEAGSLNEVKFAADEGLSSAPTRDHRRYALMNASWTTSSERRASPRRA